MNTEEIIEKLKNLKRSMVMPANEWVDFGVIIQKVEEFTGIEAHGAKQVKALEMLENLIWYASREYHNKK